MGSDLQAGGNRFKSGYLHQFILNVINRLAEIKRGGQSTIQASVPSWCRQGKLKVATTLSPPQTLTGRVQIGSHRVEDLLKLREL